MSEDVSQSEVEAYAREFIRGWAAYLDEGTEFHYRIHGLAGKRGTKIAVVFTVHDEGDRPKPTIAPGALSNLLMLGIWVADDRSNIRVVKLNYPSCLWSRESALADAESALVQAMKE